MLPLEKQSADSPARLRVSLTVPEGNRLCASLGPEESDGEPEEPAALLSAAQRKCLPQGCFPKACLTLR